MAADTNYWLIWLAYLGAGMLFYCVFWWLTAFRRARWVAYSLRAMMAALILTPWFANDQGDILAPALMVMTLDAITIGMDTLGRAGSPLLLSIVIAEVLATVLYFLLERDLLQKIFNKNKKVE